MSESNSPGESQRGAPKFFVGCEDDESEVLEGSLKTDMELFEDDEDTDSVREFFFSQLEYVIITNQSAGSNFL